MRIGLGAALILPLVLFIPGVSAADAAVSYKKQVQPIFNTRCVVCHVTGAESGGLTLQRSASRASLVGAASTQSPLARVVPGDPEKSYLIHKLRGTQSTVGGSGAAMPFTDGNPAPLSSSDYETIERWIVEGARED